MAEGVDDAVYKVFISGFWVRQQIEQSIYFSSLRNPTKMTVNEFVHKDKENRKSQQPQNVGSQKAEGEVVTDLVDSRKLRPKLGGGTAEKQPSLHHRTPEALGTGSIW